MAKKPNLKVVESAGVGHNSEMTPEQRHTRFMRYYGEMREFDEKIASLTGKRRSLLKQAKDDGFKKWEFDFAKKLEGDEDNSLVQRRNRETELAAFFKHPIGTQMTLPLEESIDRRPVEERAYDQGKSDGMANKPLKEPPFAQGAGREEYTKGWHDGRALFDSVNRPPSDEVLRPVAETEKQGADEFDATADGDGPDVDL